MARILYENESSARHLNYTRRHIRLCKQTKGAEKFAAFIQALYDELIVRQKAAGEKDQERENSYDDLILSDTVLDDSVRTAFEKCKQYDRDNPGKAILLKMFPDGKFTPIINTERTVEPDVVEQLALRFESLGAEHPLIGMAADLRARIQQTRQAIGVYNETIRQQKLAEAEEEIARGALRRKYEANMLDARKEFGKTLADRLFPQITRVAEEEEQPPPANPTA